MSAAPQWYRIEARCPTCGSPPRIRASLAQIQKWQDEPPETVVQSYRCHYTGRRRDRRRARSCDTIYPIRADAYQRAGP